MISKKIKTVIKIAIWGYIIITVCPQLVDATLSLGGALVSGGLKWCGGQISEGIKDSIAGNITDFPGKDVLGKAWEKGWEVPDSSNPFKDWLGKLIADGKIGDRPLDEEDMRILADLSTKGGTVITR